MSVADQSAPAARETRRLPLAIRLLPQFVNRLFGQAREAAAPNREFGGLLFGSTEEYVVCVHAFRSFADTDVDSGTTPEREHRQELCQKLLVASRSDPEVSGLELIGWYSVRLAGGLRQSDVDFHNQHFKGTTALALILKLEEQPHVLLELYARSANALLTADEHRWGAIRLLTTTPAAGPLEVTMRSKIRDTLYLRTYDVGRSSERAERREQWKNTLQHTKEIALDALSLKRLRSEPEPQPEGGPGGTVREPMVPKPEPVLEQQRSSPPSAIIVRPGRSGVREPSAIAEPKQSPQPVSAGDPPMVPALIAEKKAVRVPWLSSAVLFTVAAGLTFGVFLVEGLRSGNDLPAFVRVLFPSSELALRADGRGDSILLTWNRLHPAVRSGAEGTLQIDDGAQHRTVHLDSAQVSNGSVLYRPASDDVTFRLEIRGQKGAIVTGSTRVLDGVKAPAIANDTGTNSTTTTAAIPTVEHREWRTAERNTSAPEGDQRSTASKSGHAEQELKPAPLRESPSAPIRAAVEPATQTGAPIDSNAKSNGEISAPPPEADGSPRASAERGSPTAESTQPTVPGSYQLDSDAKTASPKQTSSGPQTPASDLRTNESNPPGSVPLQTAASPQANPSVPATRNSDALYVPPRPIRQILPNMKALPRGIITSGSEIDVLVSVDSTGRVRAARVVNQSRKVNSLTAAIALDAAKQWTFQPATLRGRPVASEHTIVFQFHPLAR